jgi:hypothetical protein
MSARNTRTQEELRRAIAAERDQLATAVDTLRAGIDEVTNVGAKVRDKLPAVTAAALGAGFVLAGGVGATMRLFARKSREGTEIVSLGRFRLVDRED